MTRTLRLVPKVDRRPLLRETIRNDFTVAPDMSVTPEEGRLIWGLERSTCQDLLDTLVAEGFLGLLEGRYRRSA